MRLIRTPAINDFHWTRAMQLDDVKSQRHAGASWQGILDVIPTAAYTCNTTGLITYFNPLAETVWGRAPTLRDASERYCGSHRLYLSDGTPIRHEQCWMALALIEGTAYHGREILIERRDGSRTLGLAYAHPVRNAQGRVIGAVNLVADVTAQELSTNLEKPAVPFSATVAMIEVAVSVFAGLPWAASAFN
jgi:two-component system, LuxR family, sensor kinase FixL